MIKYALKCECGYRFDSWFRSSQSYDELHVAGQITCPACGASTVRKAPMAPSVPSKRSLELSDKEKNLHDRLFSVISKVQKEISENCDNVGENFAEEARKIHYGEAPARGIYGQTTDEEAEALEEEEIEFFRMPWVKPKKTQ
jgi:hypothetical protein